MVSLEQPGPDISREAETKKSYDILWLHIRLYQEMQPDNAKVLLCRNKMPLLFIVF